MRGSQACPSITPVSSSPSHSAVLSVMSRMSSFGDSFKPSTSSRSQVYENFILLNDLKCPHNALSNALIGHNLSAIGCFGWYKPTSPPPGSLILVIDPHRSSCTSEHWTPLAVSNAISA